MQNFSIISQFKVEDLELKISRRYRIICGIDPNGKDERSYWIEIYIPTAGVWIDHFKYKKWSTIGSLYNSSEFLCLMSSNS